MEIIKDDHEEDDIKNLFIYLSGNISCAELVNCSKILSNIDTSGLFSKEDAKNIQNILLRKSKDGMISFEQFKSIWITKLGGRPTVKDATKHFIDLMNEILSINGYNPIDKKEFKLDKDNLVKIIMCLEITLIKEDADELAEDLVNSIDSNADGEVSLKDFEFLLEEYLNDMGDRKNKKL